MFKYLRELYNNLFGPKIESEAMREAQVRAYFEDLGEFVFTEDGFECAGRKGIFYCKWDDIESVFLYKEDLLTTDEICLEIIKSDQSSIRFSESMPGWYQFTRHLIAKHNSIDKNWESAIMLPPFERNLTLLFDRQGRLIDQVLESFKKQ